MRGFVTLMTALTPDLDSEDAVCRPIPWSGRNVSICERRTSDDSTLRCLRQLDDRKVPPSCHELDDQMQTTYALALTDSYRPSWSWLKLNSPTSRR